MSSFARMQNYSQPGGRLVAAYPPGRNIEDQSLPLTYFQLFGEFQSIRLTSPVAAPGRTNLPHFSDLVQRQASVASPSGSSANNSAVATPAR